MAIDYPNSPSPGDHHTHDGKTWTFTDGKWALNVSSGGVRGPAGVAIQGTAPATTDVLWADTSVSGVAVIPADGTTGQMLVKSSSTSYDTAWATPVTSSDLALKANLANPTFTGTVAGITKTMVGLGSVDNTTDASKPISTAQQTALNLKAPLASPALTGTPTSTTAAPGTNNTQIATTAYTDAAVAALVDSAPATLNTLDELALALGDDANFATTTATAIGLKAPLSSPALTGTPTAPTASVGTNTTQIATTEFVQVANPTGAVIAFAGSSAPTNWLLCYGQAVSRTTYAALFAVVSTTYGAGDGTTTFNLPDLRGRTVAGVDNMGGSDAGRIDIANSSGTVVGSQYVTLTGAQSGVPAHSHANTASFSGSAASHNHTQDSHNHSQNAHTHAQVYNGAPTGASLDGSLFAYGTVADLTWRGVNISSTTATNNATTATNQSTSITPAGSVTMTNANNVAASAAESHSVMQPTMVLNYIIKA